MAQQKRKSGAKKAAETRKANAKSNRQIKSVVWFAVAIFLLCVVFIEGENLWLWLHNLMFGVFGITAYVWPFVLGIVAVVYAMDKINKCPMMKTKTFCSQCKIHCYQKEKQQQIKKVMRYSGPRMIFYHPILAIKHALKI